MDLPSMEILGFYDQPYRIRGERASLASPPPGPAATTGRDAPEPARDPTKSLVASLWDQIDIGDGILDWTPSIISRRKLGGRTLSTGVIVTSLVLSAVLSAVLWFALQRGPRLEAAADSALGQAITEVTESGAALAEVSRSLGATEAPNLSDASAVILQAEDDARDLFARAGALAEDDPRRPAAVAGAGTILDSASLAGRLLAYRLSAEQVLVPPVLPSDPSVTELASATEAATAWRAGVEAALAELPSGTLGEHREMMQQWVGGLESWQIRYLDAVREEDTVAMASALTGQSATISDLRTDLVDRLGEAGAELGRDLDGAVGSLGDLLGG